MVIYVGTIVVYLARFSFIVKQALITDKTDGIMIILSDKK